MGQDLRVQIDYSLDGHGLILSTLNVHTDIHKRT